MIDIFALLYRDNHTTMADTFSLKNEYVTKYLAGEHRFYRFLLTLALNKLVMITDGELHGITPELEFLQYSEKFMVLYRREGDAIFLEIAKLFRRAANKVYRVMLKKGLTKINNKFLNVVQ